jgi:hypothetical protein
MIAFSEWFYGESVLGMIHLKCIALICRKTFAFRKPRATIALEEFMKFAGSSRATVKRALFTLRQLHLLRVTGPRCRPRVYELLVAHNIESGGLNKVSLPK